MRYRYPGRAPRSLALGLALLIGVPFAALLVFVVGLFIGGWWLALMAVVLYAIALVLGVAVSGLCIRRWLQRASGRSVPLAGAVLLGLVLLLLVSVVPVVEGLVVALAMPGGLGALALTALHSSHQPTVSAPEQVYRTPVASARD